MVRIPALLVGLSLLVTPPVVAQDGAATFARDLEKVRGAMESGKWSHALDSLQRMLEAHQGQDYVRLRRDEVIELHRRCLFRVRVKEPTPVDVVSGRLLACDLTSGRIKIRYTPAALQDFKREKEILWHSAPFVGPYTIEIKGREYPPFGRDRLGRVASPTIHAAVDAKRGFAVAYGFESTGESWVPARIADYATGLVVAEREMTLARAGEKFRLKVKVGTTMLSAYYNNRPLLKTRKASSQFGYWGLSNFQQWDEILLSGQAQPSWLQGRLDAHRQRQLQKFARTYRAAKELPKWLFKPLSRAPASTTARRAAGKTGVIPGPKPTAAQQRCIDRALEYIQREEFDRCLRYLDRLGEHGLAPAQGAFLRGLRLTAMEDYAGALPHLKKLCALDAEFVLGHRLLVSAAVLAGRAPEAVAAIRTLLAGEPGRADLHVALIECLLRSGRYEAARDAHLQARKAGARSRELDRLGRTIAQALRGPDWGRVQEYRSEHYVIKSDIDRETCAQAARILEDAYRAYRVHLQWLKADSRRFTVYLFSGQAGFRAYAENAMGGTSTHAAGLYSPVLKQLMIWNLPDRAAMMRVVRHEGFHQYLDRVMVHPPTWLNEGLAEYDETADHVSGRWRIGKVREDHLESLGKDARILALHRFLYLPAERFYGDPRRNYAQAWALVHFLRHGPKRYRELLDRLFSELQGRESARAVQDRVFSGVDLDALEAALRRYVKSLAART